MDTTERLHFHFSLSPIGEGNGNPLQCSCLENPRDGGAWWAAVFGVTQSRTQLKQLSSSSSRQHTEKQRHYFANKGPSSQFSSVQFSHSVVSDSLLLLLLLLSRFSRVRLCATPKMAAHQALLSLGFSRQEHWRSDALRPHELQHPRSPCPSPTLGVHSDSHPSSQ